MERVHGEPQMTLPRLKWLTIVVPVAFLVVVYVLLHTVFESLHEFPGIVALAVWAVVFVALFSFSVFRLIGRLERRILEQNRDLSALLEVGHVATTSLDLGDILARSADAVLSVTGADAVEVWLLDGDHIDLAMHRGSQSVAFSERARLDRGEGLPGAAASAPEAFLIDDLATDPRVARPAIREAGFAAYWAVPLRHREETLGAIGIASRSADEAADQTRLAFLTGIAERVASAVANSRLHDQVLGDAVVEERIRIARELHDGLAQVLGYINTQTLAVSRLIESGRTEEARAQLESMGAASREVYTDVREAILGLRLATDGPADFLPTLRSYLDSFQQMTELETALELQGTSGLSLAPAVEIQLVRIVQEALSNVRKHAHASRVVVCVEVEDGEATVEVVDDGLGLRDDLGAPTGWPRFGMRTMKERADSIGGSFDVHSVPGQGTTVRVRIPVHARALDASPAG